MINFLICRKLRKPLRNKDSMKLFSWSYVITLILHDVSRSFVVSKFYVASFLLMQCCCSVMFCKRFLVCWCKCLQSLITIMFKRLLNLQCQSDFQYNTCNSGTSSSYWSGVENQNWVLSSSVVKQSAVNWLVIGFTRYV